MRNPRGKAAATLVIMSAMLALIYLLDSEPATPVDDSWIEKLTEYRRTK